MRKVLKQGHRLYTATISTDFEVGDRPNLPREALSYGNLFTRNVEEFVTAKLVRNKNEHTQNRPLARRRIFYDLGRRVEDFSNY